MLLFIFYFNSYGSFIVAMVSDTVIRVLSGSSGTVLTAANTVGHFWAANILVPPQQGAAFHLEGKPGFGDSP